MKLQLNDVLHARNPHKRGQPPQNVLKECSNNVHKSLKYSQKHVHVHTYVQGTSMKYGSDPPSEKNEL
jgi:hypothetical protein